MNRERQHALPPKLIGSEPDGARWRLAGVLDAATIVLLVLALSVTLFGGLRVRSVSMTSPVRAWLWVVAVLVLRHWIVRRPSLPDRLRAATVSAWRSDDLRVSLAVTVGSRCSLLLVGFLAVMTIGFTNEPRFRVSENEVLNLPARWDSGWYIGIAMEGYRWRPGPLRQQNVVFFPAYPLLLRAGVRLLGGDREAIGIVGMGLSLAAFCIALVYFRRLARDQLDEAGADTAMWLLAAYPFAVFYSAVYTESLFLVATLGAFCEFRRDRLRAAGCWGLVAGLTRPNGCLLSLALAANIVERALAERRDRAGEAGTSHRRLALRVLTAGMPGVGMLIYSAFIYRVTGNAFEWARGHLAWGRNYEGPLAELGRQYELIATRGLYQYTSTFPIDALNLVAVLLAIVSIWPVARRWGLSCAVIVALGVFVPLSSGGLISIGRLTAVLFPVFLWLAQVIPARARPAWIVAFAMGQAFNGVLFFTWGHLV